MSLIKKNVVSFGEINETLSERLETFFSTEMSQDKRHKNYLPELLDLKSHLSYDILMDEASGDIVTGCGVYNGGRYAQGIYRIMNRVFIHPNYRQQSKDYPFLATKHLLVDQMSRLEAQIDFAFVSREGKYANHFLELWIKAAQDAGLGKWVISDGFAHVAPKGRNKKCFQRIAYPSNKTNPLTEISEDQWLQLGKLDPC